MTYFVEHYEKRDYIYPLSRQEIYFKLKTNIQNITKVEFIYFEKIRKISEKSIVLENFSINGSSMYYFGRLKYQETIKYIDYYFKISTIDNTHYYSPEGLINSIPRRSFIYSDTNYYDVFRTPSWANQVIGYQIFPDRFNIGKNILINKPTAWDESPTRENFFGGNIQGIIEKIDYLKEVNIGVIYLTPVFRSYSNHKYDTVDYFDIDPGFGTKEEFHDLVKKLHGANIRLVIDGVFNHIGYYSSQFQDVIKKGKESIYFDWFYIDGDKVDTEDINYECVGYYKWMPKLRYESKAVRDYINSIGRYWLERFDIDGYRLDVCDEVDYTFWYEFRKTVKSIKPTAVLIGETWKNGSDLLRGDSMDTIMNYRIRNALVDFIVDEHIDIKQFLDRVESIYFDYPYQTHNMLYNLLGSHDTERVITLCKEDTKILKLLVSILFALPGMPFIYYGDEIGTKGENDPLSRKTMNWNNIRNDIHMYYLKKTEEWSKLDVLKLGDFKHIYTEYNMIYAFERNYEEQKIIFVANCNNKEQLVKIEDYNLEFTLLPYESEIIKI